MTRSIILAVAVGAIAVGVLGWRVLARPGVWRTDAVVACDYSESVIEGTASCLALADRALHRTGLSKGASLRVLVPGDALHNNEPILVAEYEIPSSRRALEGTKAVAQRKRELLVDLRDRLQRLPRAKTSPIFVAVKRGLEQLNSACHSTDDCTLDVRTDLIETAEPHVRQALNQSGPVVGLPRLANEGIRVTICGLSESNPSAELNRRRGNAQTEDRVRDVWRSLFAAPALVSFAPFCPDSSEVLR